MPEKTVRSKIQSKVKSVKTPVKVSNLTVLPGGKLNNFLNKYSDKIINLKNSKTVYIVIIIIGLLLLAVYKKNWFVAATVNGSPINNLELQLKLNQQFRSKSLDQLITEKIILDEARKNNTIPVEAEIDEKIKEIEAQVGGAQALDSVLTQQGQSRSLIRDLIRTQIAMTKLYEKEATVSAEEIAKFIEENKDQLRATDSASQEKEAYDVIKNQKLTEIFPQKFQELHTKAKIQIF